MVFDPGLNVGETITNKKITEIFGGNSQYGMSRSLKNNTLVLRSKPDSSYNDRWVAPKSALWPDPHPHKRAQS